MMARSRRQSKRSSAKRPDRRFSSASDSILREWRGYDEPLDLSEGVHRAGEFLDELLQSAGVKTGIQEEELQATWKQLAGEFIANHTKPVSIRNGELLLRVSQPALRFQLDRMKPELLKRIHQTLGETIRTIRFTHG